MATLEEVARILGGLAMLYPRHTLTEATITAYHRVLEDIEEPLLDRAALHLGSTNAFFPAASELRAAAFELVDAASGIPDAFTAWGEVMKSFGPYGRYRVPEWTHPLIKESVDAIGGYLNLCNSDNATADRARFIQAYETLARRRTRNERMLPPVRAIVAELARELTPALNSGGDDK